MGGNFMVIDREVAMAIDYVDIKVAWEREFTVESGVMTSVCGLSHGNVQEGTLEKKLCLWGRGLLKAHVIG